MTQQAARSDLILKALRRRHPDCSWFTEISLAGGQLRADGLALRRSEVKPCVTIYEVKISRSDFERDDKWPNYMPWCNCFAFACPTGLIQAEELPEDVGLIWYNPATSATLAKRKAKFRAVQIPSALYATIVFNRLASDQHPFFTSRREALETWAADKADRRDLAERVGGKLAQMVREIAEERLTLENKGRRLAWLREILKEIGIDPDSREADRLLRRRLADTSMVDVLPRAVEAAETIERSARELLKLIHP